MYIEPNTTIKLYSGIPLDNTYNHTLYFASLSAQNAYFHGNTAKYTLASNSYQRVERGRMRIEKKADDLYDCNYLAFQNTNYGNKWFYAFITGVEYINNITSEITFEIDSMQSYLFDVEIKSCFVEREHSLTDDIGDNLLPEPVDLGEIVSDDFDGTGQMGAKSVVLAHVGLDSALPYKGGDYSGIYSGLKYMAFDNNATSPNGWQALNNVLDNITTQLFKDRVIGLFTIPTCFVTEMGDPIVSLTVTKTKNITNIGGYPVRNKKLLTYPYNYLAVNNLQGDEAIYKYEFFNSDNCVFTLTGDYNILAQALLIPMQYKGIPANYEEALAMETTAQMPFNVTSFIEEIGSSALKTAVAFNSKDKNGKPNNVAGVVSGGVSIAENLIHSVNYHGVSNSTILVSANIMDYAFMHKHVQVEYAKIIDTFFSMYGYATNRVKVPNISSRPHWNYVKTKGCVAVGSAPSDEIRRICSIYDNGITFWKNPSEVGQYLTPQGELIFNSPT